MCLESDFKLLYKTSRIPNFLLDLSKNDNCDRVIMRILILQAALFLDSVTQKLKRDRGGPKVARYRHILFRCCQSSFLCNYFEKLPLFVTVLIHNWYIS